MTEDADSDKFKPTMKSNFVSKLALRLFKRPAPYICPLFLNTRHSLSYRSQVLAMQTDSQEQQKKKKSYGTLSTNKKVLHASRTALLKPEHEVSSKPKQLATSPVY